MRTSLLSLLLVLPLMFTCVTSRIGEAGGLADKSLQPAGSAQSGELVIIDAGDTPAKSSSHKIDLKKSRKQESGSALFQEPSRGEQVMRAFLQAYPDKIDRVEFRDGDWAVLVRGSWFFWSGGRLLPESEKDNPEKYSPYPFYPYTRELSPLPDLTEDEKKELEKRLQQREHKPPNRHPGFYNTLWDVYDQESSWRKVKTIYFLGHKTDIHRELLEDLAAVEEEIQRLMQEDGEVRRYVQSLTQLHGYNWRPIAGTRSLSFHSYGSAIDLLPSRYGGKQVYWRWAKPNFPEWYSLPYEKRFMPPPQIYRVFEEHGFIWGGKWFFFDTIHFEYRPEILVLNGLLK